MSKVRYGNQLWANTRTREDDTTNGDMKKIQVAQNRLLRLLEGCKVKDKVPIKTMLANTKLPL